MNINKKTVVDGNESFNSSMLNRTNTPNFIQNIFNLNGTLRSTSQATEEVDLNFNYDAKKIGIQVELDIFI
jgi:hypothetical protein